MKKASMLLACMLLVWSCKQPMDQQGSGGNVPGHFGVSAVSSSLSRSVSIGSVTVNTSSDVFFILKNVGDTSITGISLSALQPQVSQATTTDKSFVVSPGSISELLPDKTSPLSLLVRVDINHGAIYGLVGQQNYVDPAVTGTTIHIAGTTTDANGSPLPTSLDCDLATLFKLADWEIHISTDNWATYKNVGKWNQTDMGYHGNLTSSDITLPATLNNSNGESSTWVDANIKARVYNTGNTSLIVYPDVTNGSLVNGVTILPGQFATLIFDSFASMSYIAFRPFAIDTQGTVFDNSVGVDLDGTFDSRGFLIQRSHHHFDQFHFPSDSSVVTIASGSYAGYNTQRLYIWFDGRWINLT